MQYTISSVEELVVKYGTVGIKEAISKILSWETGMVYAYRFVEEFLVVIRSGKIGRRLLVS